MPIPKSKGTKFKNIPLKFLTCIQALSSTAPPSFSSANSVLASYSDHQTQEHEVHKLPSSAIPNLLEASTMGTREYAYHLPLPTQRHQQGRDAGHRKKV